MAHPVLYIDAEKESQGAWLFFSVVSLRCLSIYAQSPPFISSKSMSSSYSDLGVQTPKFLELLAVAVYSNE